MPPTQADTMATAIIMVNHHGKCFFLSTLRSSSALSHQGRVVGVVAASSAVEVVWLIARPGDPSVAAISAGRGAILSSLGGVVVGATRAELPGGWDASFVSSCSQSGQGSEGSAVWLALTGRWDDVLTLLGASVISSAAAGWGEALALGAAVSTPAVLLSGDRVGGAVGA